MAAAGIKDFTFHDLRHTFATQQRFLGRDITVIKELLGHRSTKMTERYAHLRPTELKEANDALGAKILGVKSAQNSHSDGSEMALIESVQSKSVAVNQSDLNFRPCGGMADAQDLKSWVWQRTCGFRAKAIYLTDLYRTAAFR
jgi:hypothetical protein